MNVFTIPAPPAEAIIVPLQASVTDKTIVLSERLAAALQQARKAGADHKSWVIVGMDNRENQVGVSAHILAEVVDTMPYRIEVEFLPGHILDGDLVLYNADNRRQDRVTLKCKPQYKFQGWPVVIAVNAPAVEVWTPDTWIEKAKNRKGSSALFQQFNWGSLATDGLRIHYDPRVPFHDNAPRCELPDEIAGDVVRMINATDRFPDVADLSKALLLKAVKGVARWEQRIRIDWSKSTSTMKIMYRKCENADLKLFSKGSAKVHCRYSGEKRTVYIFGKYLLDALMGMQEKAITIRMSDHQMCITDGQRLALIEMMKPIIET